MYVVPSGGFVGTPGQGVGVVVVCGAGEGKQGGHSVARWADPLTVEDV